MASSPTATSFAVLGLLGLQPWTAYDLVAQTRRSLHFFWPRSEAHLYAELKRLVERRTRPRRNCRRPPTPSHPLHHHARRPRCVRRMARNRAGSTPQSRSRRCCVSCSADHGSLQDLRAALRATARQTSDLRIGRRFDSEEAAQPPVAHFPSGCTSSNGSGRCTASFSCCSSGGAKRHWPRSRLGRTRANCGLTPQGRKRFAQSA